MGRVRCCIALHNDRDERARNQKLPDPPPQTGRPLRHVVLRRRGRTHPPTGTPPSSMDATDNTRPRPPAGERPVRRDGWRSRTPTRPPYLPAQAACPPLEEDHRLYAVANTVFRPAPGDHEVQVVIQNQNSQPQHRPTTGPPEGAKSGSGADREQASQALIVTEDLPLKAGRNVDEDHPHNMQRRTVRSSAAAGGAAVGGLSPIGSPAGRRPASPSTECWPVSNVHPPIRFASSCDRGAGNFHAERSHYGQHRTSTLSTSSLPTPGMISISNDSQREVAIAKSL